MLEIGLNKRTLILNGERISITNELAHWIQKNTSIAITFNLKEEE
jgi:hypothetical protein